MHPTELFSRSHRRTHCLQAFVEVYNVLRDEILKEEKLGNPPEHAAEWFKEVSQRSGRSGSARSTTAIMPLTDSSVAPQVLDYNVPGGKLNRGMAVYDVLAAIKGAEVCAAGSC